MLELFDGGEQKKNGTYACREKGMPCAAILIELIRSRLVYPWIVLRIRFYSERGSVDNLSLSLFFFSRSRTGPHTIVTFVASTKLRGRRRRRRRIALWKISTERRMGTFISGTALRASEKMRFANFISFLPSFLFSPFLRTDRGSRIGIVLAGSRGIKKKGWGGVQRLAIRIFNHAKYN